MYVFILAWKSLCNRWFTTLLTICSIALSVGLLIGVERVREGARDSFANTISQTDLIVGAKGGTIQLLLYAVFRMGSATNNITTESWQYFAKHPATDWTIPYSLGDSHRGFRVVGTNEDFYTHYHYRGDHGIEFAQGSASYGIFDVILGSDVAERIGYKIADKIVLAHGVADEAIIRHDDKPFTVVGILKKTATPIDRSVYITLEGMEAIHMDWTDGAPPMRGKETPANTIQKENIKVGQITAFLLRTKSRIETLRLQREVNIYTGEPLMAIIPGVALSELWNGISYAEGSLRVVSLFVIVVGLLGMLVSLYNSLNERRREMAIFRAVGAGPVTILALLVLESFFLTLAGIVAGGLFIYTALYLAQPIIEKQFGLFVPLQWLTLLEWCYLGGVLFFGLVLGLVPAFRAYKNTLSDGLTIRV